MYLCIDTITAAAGVGLAQNEKLAAFLLLERHLSSERLFETLERLFAEAGCRPADLKGVAVLRGPGSFTGLRVGIAVANTFAHQLKIPIIGLTTDEWYRLGIPEPDFLYVQTLNTDEVYAVGFGRLKLLISNPILPLGALPQDTPLQWGGELSLEHRAALPPSFKSLNATFDVGKAWLLTSASLFSSENPSKGYALVEPYYGKAPHITPRKHDVKIQVLQ